MKVVCDLNTELVIGGATDIIDLPPTQDINYRLAPNPRCKQIWRELKEIPKRHMFPINTINAINFTFIVNLWFD